MTTPELPSKRDILTAILARGDAYLHLDARQPGVDVPDWLKGDPNLCLQLGYEMPIPIPDLAIEDDGVRATLSFRRQPFACFIPWRAIFLVVDAESRGMLWEDDAPAEARAQQPRAPDPGPRGRAAGTRRRLHSVPPVGSPDELADELAGPGPSDVPPPPVPEPPRPRPPHLRIVK